MKADRHLHVLPLIGEAGCGKRRRAEHAFCAYFTHGFESFHAPCNFTRFIGGLLRTNEAAQLNGAPVGFDPDLE
jgi:hypothetical protein